MATGRGRRRAPVIERLREEPYRFEFAQAVRILELMRPDAPAVGTGSVPEREAVRFSSTIHSGFPASELDRVDFEPGSNRPARLSVNFLGLAGHQGPLPEPFVSLVQRRSIQKDNGLRDFLDLFNHRLISLLTRIKRKHSPVLDPRPPHETHFARYLAATMGMGTGGLSNRLGVPDRALLYYAGLMSNRPRPLSALLVMLRHYLNAPVSCRPFRGAWYRLAEDQITVLGRYGRNQRLGRGAVLGSRVWGQDWCFELSIGPVGWRLFRDLLPDGRGHRPLLALIRLHVGHEFDCDIRLRLKRDDVPQSRLVRGDEAPRLGWTSFLTTRPVQTDDDQVILRARWQAT